MPLPLRDLLDRLAQARAAGVSEEADAVLRELVEAVSADLEDLGAIGAGGMGEVRRVYDADLQRVVARKTLAPALVGRPGLEARFLAEARTTAQLQHPGVAPVYARGELADGRPWFTMKEVVGRTLKEVVSEVHAASRGDRWEVAPSGWSFRRLVEALNKVCDAVAYAHARGVVHRDLKPSNIMIGEFGEVVVLDWGLAASAGEPGGAHPYGTPAYMPPEVARGGAVADPRADVYALGAVLYQILSDRPPFTGHAGMVLERLRAGPPLPPGRLPPPTASTALATVVDGSGVFLSAHSETEVAPDAVGPFPSGAFAPALGPGPRLGDGPPLPEPLLETCARAMAREPADRFPDAGALGRELAAWLDGLRVREEALVQVAAADERGPEVRRLRERAHALRREAEAALEAIPPHHPADERIPWWRRQDEAAALELDAERAEVRRNQLLQAALASAPDLPEARARLADFHREQLEAAEAARDWRATLRHEADLRVYDDGRHAAWLLGDGALTLVTDPPGATVDVYQYQPVDRRLVPRLVAELGPTPLRERSLAMGSYLLVIRAPGRVPVRYPVLIRRQHHWDGVPPGADTPAPIRLPLPSELGPEDRFVPPGWALVGGDPDAHASAPGARVWVDGFVIRRFPVTVGDYIAWLDALAVDDEARALEHAPRIPGLVGERGQLLGRDAAGRFHPKVDDEGDAWQLDWPLLSVSWHDAREFAAWEASRTGQAWRLPVELEWEKAARGVDGRFLPWGDFHDPSWSNMRDSTAGRMLPTAVDTFPVDESVYGARGMAGNARCWCLDAFSRAGPTIVGGRALVTTADPAGLVASRGGTFGSNPQTLRPASRYMSEAHVRGYTGIRLVRTWP